MRKTIMTKYYHISGTPEADQVEMGYTGSNYIMLDLFYDHGYMLSVKSIGHGKDDNGTFDIFNILSPETYRKTLIECNRQSSKKAAEAVQIMESSIKDILDKHFSQYDVEIA